MFRDTAEHADGVYKILHGVADRSRLRSSRLRSTARSMLRISRLRSTAERPDGGADRSRLRSTARNMLRSNRLRSTAKGPHCRKFHLENAR